MYHVHVRNFINISYTSLKKHYKSSVRLCGKKKNGIPLTFIINIYMQLKQVVEEELRRAVGDWSLQKSNCTGCRYIFTNVC